MSPTSSRPLPSQETLAFEPDWSSHGHIDRAAALIEEWSRGRPIEGLSIETVRLPGRTPVILMEVPGTSPETILLYGHRSTQPETIARGARLRPRTPRR